MLPPRFSERPSAGLRLLAGVAGPFLDLHRILHDRGVLGSWRAAVPVVSVGNLTVGGTGKTPCVLWLARALRARGRRPAILSRGYGRTATGIHVVTAASTPAAAGDEPLELAAALPDVPVLVGRDRRATARRSVSAGGIDLLLLDDGFQHRPLHRDLDIVLLDAAAPFGNGHRLPAGPLRERPEALRRARILLLTRADRAGDLAATRRRLADLAPDAWISTAEHGPAGLVPLDPAVDAPPPVAGQEVIVAVGVADPAAVAGTVRALGLAVGELLSFGDHHRFDAADRHRVDAARNGRPVVTTAKDAVRWRASGVSGAGWWVARVAFRPAEPEELLARIPGTG